MPNKKELQDKNNYADSAKKMMKIIKEATSEPVAVLDESTEEFVKPPVSSYKEVVVKYSFEMPKSGLSKDLDFYAYKTVTTGGPTKTFRCRFCRKTVQFLPSVGTPEKCPQCGRFQNDEAEFIVEHLEEGRPTDHFQIRWCCRNCGAGGVSWVAKGNKSSDFHCPKCGASDHHVIRNKINATGECNSAWRDIGIVDRPRPKKMRHSCDNCGYESYYLVKPPSRCPDCGHKH